MCSHLPQGNKSYPVSGQSTQVYNGFQNSYKNQALHSGHVASQVMTVARPSAQEEEEVSLDPDMLLNFEEHVDSELCIQYRDLVS